MQAQVSTAQTRLRSIEIDVRAQDKITNSIAERNGFIRQGTHAADSSRQAGVDSISTRLEATKTKHKMALAALNTMRSVTED